MSDWNGFAIRAEQTRPAEDRLQQRREVAQRRRVEVQTQIREWIEQQGLNDWLQGKPDLIIPDEVVQALRERIDHTFTGAERRWATNFLSAGLERGRLERGWTVRVPPRILVLRAPTPPLNALTFPALTQEGLIDQALQAHWQECARDHSAVTLEQVLISMIWSSALIGEDRIRQAAAALRANTLRVSPDGRWVWTEWTDRSGNWQRHLLDPLSALLALRWQSQQPLPPPTASDTESAPSVARPIWRALARRLDVQSLHLLSYIDFVRCAQAKWHYRLPPFLAHAARGRVANASLPPHAWWRMLMSQRLAPEASPKPRSDRTGTGHAPEKAILPDVIAVSSEVRRLLRSPPQRATQVVAKLRHHVQQHAADPDRLDGVLAGWLIGLLRPAGRKGQRLSSARELLARVDRKLAAVLGTHLPAEAAVWDDALQAIVQAAPERSRHNLSIALRSLDAHVRALKRWSGPPPDVDADASAVVDAQLLTEAEFQAVLQALQVSAQPRHCLAAAILGYRCGLRRSEIRGLRWIDLQLRPQPLLFVRSHAGRALKRDSGRRVLPLSAFCPQNELQLLRDIHAETDRLLQHGQAEAQTALFLPDPEAPDRPRSEESLFDPVQAAMQSVCGEQALRFHHLRHSAANHLLSLLMQDRAPGAVSLLGADPAQGSAKRTALLGSGEDRRPLLWAVSAFMGHSTPQTTLGSYVHILDLMLGEAVQRESVPPSTEIVAWLTGLTVNHVHVQHHRLDANSRWQQRSAYWVNKLATSSVHVQSLRCPWPVEPASDRPPSGATASPVDTALLNITEALALLVAVRKDPSSQESTRHLSAAQAMRIHDWMARWAHLRGNSLARRRRSALSDQPIIAGALQLDRPRTLRQLRSKTLRESAQAALEAWRQWWQQDAAAAEQALTLHWRVHDSDDHAVAFTSTADAQQWKQMLDALSHLAPALLSRPLSWQHIPASRSNHFGDEQREHWFKALGASVVISAQLPRSFHPARPCPPEGLLRVIDQEHGKTSPGGLLAALDAAAYVMTLSILLRKGSAPSPAV
ncbi:MAG: tyrosine-type recombinase/integrase [Pseudomonadota bacterium]